MLYSGAMSCVMSISMIVTTSNLAKALYHKNVMTRKEELASMKSGNDPVLARAAALTKRVCTTLEYNCIAYLFGEFRDAYSLA
jgi:uncharacterized membrane protein